MDVHIKTTDVKAYGWGLRHVQVVLVFLAVAMSYFLRINMSICIVEMTSENDSSGFPTYAWNTYERGVVLSSFFWGYVVTQVPAGLLAVRYGPKWFLLAGLVVTSVLSAVTPLLAAMDSGWEAVVASRTLQGLAQGVVYPSTHAMLSRWAPPPERARFTAIVYSGIPVGTVIGMAGSGALAASPLGWPAAFYIPGILGLVWGLAWAFLADNSPYTSSRIGAGERAYVEMAFADTCSHETLSIPWCAMLTSLPMWALFVVHSTHNFGHWVLLTELPAYMKAVLLYDIEENGFLSALPYICLVVTSLLVSWVGKVVNDRGWLTLNVSRKVFQSAAHWGAGAMLLLLGVLDVDRVGAVALLCVAVAFEAGTLAGFLCNHMDLSPNFCGAMMGITSAGGATVGILAPLLVGALTEDSDSASPEKSTDEWQIVFFVTAAVYFVGNLIWVIFGSTEVQPWNNNAENSHPKPRDSVKDAGMP